MSKERNAERDPNEPGAKVEINNATIVAVTDPTPVGQSQKFTVTLDITKNPKYHELLSVEFFGKDLPAWYNDLRHAEGQAWQFYGRAKSREYNGKWYTTVSVYWGKAMSGQAERRGPTIPPPFEYAPGEAPRVPPPPPYDCTEEIPF